VQQLLVEKSSMVGKIGSEGHKMQAPLGEDTCLAQRNLNDLNRPRTAQRAHDEA
jgi:hypothetical protein